MINFLKSFFKYKSQRLLSAGKTDQGLVRTQNEDAYYIMNDQRIFLVADGMGGHKAGEVASKIAIETLVDFFTKIPAKQLTKSVEFIQHTLITGLRQANETVIKMATSDPNLRGMGCTLVACLIGDRVFHTCHVGDTRCYLAQDGKFIQITHDHTAIAAIKQDDTLDSTKEKIMINRNVVTKAIGHIFKEDPEYNCHPIRQGDRILLCSDGLWSMLDDSELYTIITTAPTPTAATTQLIERANAEGGRDNITAVVIFN
ncbi:MAG: hypothetical protein A2511_17605 [Deltaproteobacteria bacterium RIFOXYD12_FULL_50_9]|nr:MAG: hypothetical protein A2511_17605 [Deltaproteobacteria bacterium RIFOXYD12_FULL_50_9]